MEPIILIGGGGHCKSCIDVLQLQAKYEIVGILDRPELVGSHVMDYKIIGTDSDIRQLSDKYRNFLITVGQIKTPNKRIQIYNIVKDNGGNLPVIVSPLAYVSPSSLLNEGTIVMHKCIINSEAIIGKCGIINTGCLIEHEAIVSDFCHISTCSVINGQTRIGSRSFVGSNSVIANNLNLPDDIIVAAGAVILKSPGKTGVFIGNPAKGIRK